MAETYKGSCFCGAVELTVTGEPDYSPQYFGYDGEWHYVGRPGIYHGRSNGGSFGPCWTWTPIGPIWNCG